MSVTNIIMSAAGGASEYWFNNISSSTGSQYGGNTVLDSAGNIYSSSYNSDEYSTFLKFSPAGNLIWQKRFATTGGGIVTIDSSDNIYFSSGNIIYKFNTSGDIIWQRFYGGPVGSVNFSPFNLKTDSSGNVYFACTTYDSSTNRQSIHVAKYNTSGTLLWQRKFQNNGGQNNFYAGGMTVDSSGNVYLTWACDINVSGNDIQVLKIDTSGNTTWVIRKGTGAAHYVSSIAVDPSGNIFITIRQSEMSQIIKFDSSGAFQWRKTFFPYNSITALSEAQVYCDPLGYAYFIICAKGQGTATNYAQLITKYDTNGSIVWTRKVEHSLYNYGSTANMFITSLGKMYLTTSIQKSVGGSYEMKLWKLPADGSLTGIYGNDKWQGFSSSWGSETFSDRSSPSYENLSGIANTSTPAYTTTNNTLTNITTGI